MVDNKQKIVEGSEKKTSVSIDTRLWGPFKAHAILNGLSLKEALDGMIRLFLDEPARYAKLILEKRRGKADNMPTDADDPGLIDEIKRVLPPEEEA